MKEGDQVFDEVDGRMKTIVYATEEQWVSVKARHVALAEKCKGRGKEDSCVLAQAWLDVLGRFFVWVSVGLDRTIVYTKDEAIYYSTPKPVTRAITIWDNPKDGRWILPEGDYRFGPFNPNRQRLDILQQTSKLNIESGKEPGKRARSISKASGRNNPSRTVTRLKVVKALKEAKQK